MTTTDVTYAIEVKGAQAKRELDAIGKSADTMGGGFGSLSKNLEKFDRAASQTERTLRGVQGAMGGTKSVALEAVGALGDVAGIVGGGGALGIALAAGTFAFVQVSKAITESKQRSRDFVEAITAMNTAVITMTKASIQPSRDAVRSLAQELANFGKDARQIQIDAVQMSVASLDARAETAKKNLAREQTELADMRSKFNNDALAGMDRSERIERAKDLFVQMALIDSIKKRAEATSAVLVEERANLDSVTGMALALDKKEAERKRIDARAAAGVRGVSIRTGSENVSPASDQEWTPFSQWAKGNKAGEALPSVSMVGQSASAGPMGAAKSNVASFYDEATQAAAKSTELQKAMWSDLSLTINQTMKESTEDYANAAKGAFTGAISASSSFFGTMIQADAAREAAARNNSVQGVMAAEELKRQAAAMSAAEFMSSTGQVLVGLGTEQVFKGAGYLAESFGADPRGYALVGLGTAAIAAGVGMGAAGAAISAGAGNAVGAAGDRGAAIDKARKDRGVNSGGGSSRGGSGGSGGGGGITYVTNYGIAGPQPDEVAREVSRQSQRARSRGFADESVRRGR